MDFVGVARDFGIPLALLVALCWFVAKKFWPFLVKRIEATEEQLERVYKRNEVIADQFLEALKRRDDEFSVLVDQIARKVDNIEKRGKK